MNFLGSRSGWGWVRGLVLLAGVGFGGVGAGGAALQTAPAASSGARSGASVSAAAAAAEQTANQAGSGAGATVTGTRAANGTGVPGVTAAEAAQVLPPPQGFDVQGRSREVLAHLSAVIRYYRMSLQPIQTVGEPSDLLYREQAVNQAERAGELAFQSARAEALLLTTYAKRAGTVAGQTEGEAVRLQATRAQVTQKLADLQEQDKALDAQIAKARAKDLPALEQQREEIAGQVELNTAMSEALGRVVSMSDTAGQAGLSGDIARLERSAPELGDSKLKPVVTAPLESASAARSSGVSTQATVLFRLLGTERAIDEWMREEEALHRQAMALRTPLTNIMRATIARGQQLSAQTAAEAAPPVPVRAGKPAPAPTSAQDEATLAATKKNFAAVTSTFEVLSAAAVPLSQEIITLEQSRANLQAWRGVVHEEYVAILRTLMTRLMVIGGALLLIWGAGEVWRRSTARYVHDLRRRRQLLVMRRLVVGFLSGIVLVFGFVTQFNSLATFAGFITAGLAVGLQTILLSVAAYFFIIGRYGVKVGDRITVAGVTGDVIDVGLVRFYMMELAGSGTELRPTGRVAMFSNAVLFQAGTPLYKRLPGTEYVWHELTMKLAAGADYRKAVSDVQGAVEEIYQSYQARIEQQHRDLEGWMDANVDAPGVECRMQLVDGGLQLNVRFPVEIRSAAQVDERVTEKLLSLMQNNAEVKAAVASGPEIKATVKG